MQEVFRSLRLALRALLQVEFCWRKETVAEFLATPGATLTSTLVPPRGAATEDSQRGSDTRVWVFNSYIMSTCVCRNLRPSSISTHSFLR